MSSIPILVAFVLAMGLFAAWVLTMTHTSIARELAPAWTPSPLAAADDFELVSAEDVAIAVASAYERNSEAAVPENGTNATPTVSLRTVAWDETSRRRTSVRLALTVIAGFAAWAAYAGGLRSSERRSF